MANQTFVDIVGRDLTGNAFSSASRGLKGLGKDALRTAAQVTGVGLSVAGAVQALKGVGQAGISIQRIQNSLQASVGSAERAGAAYQFVRQEAGRLGLNLEVAALQFSRLSAAARGSSLAGEETRKIFSSIAQASVVLGLSADDTRGALRAIEQIISKGNVSAEELRGQLGERIPGAFQTAARAIGVTDVELNKLLKTGRLTAEQLLPLFAEELDKTFGPQSVQASKALNAEINRFNTSLFELNVAVGESGLLDFLTESVKLATLASRALSGILGDEKVVSENAGLAKQLAEVNRELRAIERASNSISPFQAFAVDNPEGDKATARRVEALEAEKQLLISQIKLRVEISKIPIPKAKPENRAGIDPFVAKTRTAASEGEKLLKVLKKQADEAGKTGTELLRVRAALAGVGDEAEKDIVRIEKQVEASKARSEAAQALAKDLREIENITESVATNQEKLNEELDDLKRLSAITDDTGRAILSQEDYARAVQQTRDRFIELDRKASETFNDLDQFATQALRNIQSSLADFLFDPFDDGLKGMVKGFANALRRMAAEAAAARLLQGSGISAIFTGGGGNAGGSGSGGGFGFTDAASILSAGKTAFDLVSGGLTQSIAGALEGVANTFGLDTASSFLSGISGSGASVFSNAGGAGTAFIGGPGTAIGGTGTSAAATAGSAAAPILASAGLVAAAGIATKELNELIANNKKIAGVGSDVLNAVINPLSQIPILGDFLPDFGGALTALFGRGKIKQKETNLIGNVTSEGFEGVTSTKLKAEGGLFASDLVKRLLLDADTGLVTDDSTQKFPELAAQLRPLVEQFGRNLDLSIQTLSKSLTPVIDNIGTNDLSNFSTDVNIASEKGEFFNADQLVAELQRIEEEMIRHTVPSIDSLVRSGESLSQAFQRLGGDFNVLSALGNALGHTTELTKEFLRTVSVESRSAFVEQAGGQNALAGSIDFFADNFLSDVERLAPLTELVNKELTELGVSLDITKDDFKELIQTYGQLGGVTEDTVLKLLRLAPAFAQVRDASEEAEDALLDLADTQRAVTQLRSTLVSSYNRERAALQDIVNEFDNLSDTLLSFRDRLKLGDLSPLTPGQQLDESRQQFNTTLSAARAGDADAIARLPEIAQEFLRASKTFNASGGTFDSDFALVQNALSSVARVAVSEADLARAQLTELESTVSKLTDIDGNVISVEDAIRDLTVAVLTGPGNPDVTSSDIEKTTSTGSIEDILSALIKDGVNIQQLLEAGISKSIIDFVSGGASVLDDEIRAFANSQTDPVEIYRAAIAHGISAERLSRVLDVSLDAINQFLKENELPTFETARAARSEELFNGASQAGNAPTTSTPRAPAPSTNNVIQFPNQAPIVLPGPQPTVSQISNEEILAFVAANPDPFAIYDAAVKHKVSSARLASVTNTPISEIEAFVRNNGLAHFERGTDGVKRDGLAFLHKNESVSPSNTSLEIKRLTEQVILLREEQARQADAHMKAMDTAAKMNARLIATATAKIQQKAAFADRTRKAS